MYKILIQNEKDKSLWSYYKIKKEDIKIETEEVEDPDTHEISTIQNEIGLGTYSTVEYSETDPAAYEKVCTGLLAKYNLSQLKFIDEKDYQMDILWDLDSP